MKSPWKYLVELASLGRTANETDRSQVQETSQADTTSLTPATLVGDLVSPRVETPSEPASELDSMPMDIASALADRNERAAVPQVQQPSTFARIPRDRALSTKTQQRIRQTGRGNSVKVDTGEAGSSGARPPLKFCEEVATLDDEVMQLRRKLAEKLRSQNNQLKSLLERFDAK